MTAPSWARLRPIVAGCAVALGLAGCVAEEPDGPPPPTTVEHPAQKDRDERSVLAALARIDLCAVLKSPAAGTPRAPGPSSCQTGNPGGGTVVLRVQRLPAAERLKLPSRPLGGAKAYTHAAAGHNCTVSLPVSFELALAIDARGVAAGDPCEVAQTAATAAATTLADPAAARADPRWEACAALGSVPGAEVERPATMDRCAEQNGQVVLEFDYSKPGTYPVGGWRRETVGGVEVWTLEDPDPQAPSCTVEWSQGPAPSPPAENGAQLVASLRAVDCGRVTPRVEPLITTLRQPPADVPPQKPLLYGPNEPDRPR